MRDIVYISQSTPNLKSLNNIKLYYVIPPNYKTYYKISRKFDSLLYNIRVRARSNIFVITEYYINRYLKGGKYVK